MKEIVLILLIFLTFGIIKLHGQSSVTTTENNIVEVNQTYRNLITVFPFIETFEDESTTRDSWTQIQETGTESWTFDTGAEYGTITSAYEGNLNARYTGSVGGPHITKLISPFMDLTSLVTPQLAFWYGQENWGAQNELKIYYRTNTSESWTEIAFYDSNINTWTKELLILPNPSSNYQIAFEGIDNYGHSNVLDYVIVRETPTNPVDWCNLQQPGTATILNNETFDVYAQVWEDGVTDADANSAGIDIDCWIGYNNVPTNPSTWTNWIAATYNQDVEAKDEYIATIGPLNIGTYYYASRCNYQDGPYTYGGYNSTGGGDWNGTTNTSGILTVNSIPGSDCSNPYIVNIPAELPYQVLSQTNCGFINNYDNTGISSPEYDDGEDAIYRLNITAYTSIRITLNPKSTHYTSLSLFDGFPNTGTLIDDDLNTDASLRIIEVDLTEGTYYIMIDTWPSPNCILDYDLTIEAMCIEPTNIGVINLTQTSADLQWTAGNYETAWNIKVNEANPIDPNLELGNIVENTLVSTTPTYSITSGLTLDTDYYVYIQSACWSEWVTYSFTTPTACPIPTGLTSTVLGSNTVILTWNELGMSDWTIKISTTPLSDPENESADIIDNTNIADGIAQYYFLDSNDDIIYYWYVKSNCGSDWSMEDQFTTTCEPSQIPFIEDFTGTPTGELPKCWDKSQINWSINESSLSGGMSPELRFYWDPEMTGEIFAYLPTIDATTNTNLIMSFLHNVNYFGNSFDLRLDYTIDDGLTWNTAWQTNVTNNIDPEEVFVDLSPLVDGEVFQLAFVFSGNSYDINFWFIDNINIRSKNLIDQMDIDSDVYDILICVGEEEAIAIADLATQMIVSDMNGSEYIVDLTWTIDSYDSLIIDDYIATGTFTLPSGIEQTTIPTPLEVTAIVSIIDPSVILFSFETLYCIGSSPEEFPYISDNNIAGTWFPANITTYSIGDKDYTFTPNAGECTDVDSIIITITVQYPEETTFSFQTAYCVGDTPDVLPTISDDNYTGTWNPATINTDTAAETNYTFTPTNGECVLVTTIPVSVTDIPVVTCPDNFTVTKDSIITLSNALPAGGTYSGTGVTENNFDPSSLINGDYTINYTYPNTGCSNSCDFIITVNIANSINSNETAEISIYPNPNSGIFILSFGNIYGIVNYQIYDTKGSIITDKNIQTNGKTIEKFSVRLIPGVYYIKIITISQTYVKKLVIE